MGTSQKETRETIDLIQSKQLLMKYGIPVNDSRLALSLPDALKHAEQLGWPLVLKIASPDISHKSDVGGVKTNIRTAVELENSYNELLSTVNLRIPTARITGVILERMIENGVEIIVGMKKDPVFGRVFLFGMGGIYTEILRDVSIRVEPLDREDIHNMIAEVKGYEILTGARGKRGADMESIVNVILKLQQLVTEDPQILEVDLNPIILSDSGPIVVDARIVRGEHLQHVASQHLDKETMHALLSPTSVAVIGASKDLGKPGGMTMQNLTKRGFGGQVFPVNIRETEIQGKKCFSSIKEIPVPIDLAAISVPARSTMQVISECVEKHTKTCVIFSSGFAEAGHEGLKLQENIINLTRSGRLRICGPNCEGIVIPKINLYATFATDIPQTLQEGNIALVTQSGGLGEAMLSYFAERDLGLRAWISCGNGADLEISDYVDCFSEDSATRIICLLMEGVGNGDGLKRALAKAADARKPVVAIKLGRSEVGAAIAKSHTGSLVGSDEVYNTVFTKYGVLRVNDIEELIDLAMAIDWQPLPNGHKIGVVSGSGGQIGMIADACAGHGLELPKFSEETQKKLEELLKVKPSNPIDYFLPGVSISQESLIAGTCAQIMAEANNIDAVVIANNCLGEHAETFAKTISGVVNSIRAQLKKPVYVNWTMAGGVSLYDTVKIFYQNKVPVYPTPTRTIRAIKAATMFSDFSRTIKG